MLEELEWVVTKDWCSPTYSELKTIDKSLIYGPRLGTRMCKDCGGSKVALILGNVLRFYEQTEESSVGRSPNYILLKEYELLPTNLVTEV